MRCTCVMLLLVLAGPGVLADVPTETSVVAAWEAAQGADPNTAAFEWLGGARYRFETTRAPFTGELAVLTVNLDAADLPGSEGAVMGAAEVEARRPG